MRGRLIWGVIALPLALSYLWKKNHVYTIIEYDDEITKDDQKIVILFPQCKLCSSLNLEENVRSTKM
jgi:hypothetical protein